MTSSQEKPAKEKTEKAFFGRAVLTAEIFSEVKFPGFF
jgi:UTP-glucose-1-phosphate uridylyltransferase